MGRSDAGRRVVVFRTSQPGRRRRDEAGDHGEGERFGKAGLERRSYEMRKEGTAREERHATRREVDERWSEEGADRVVTEESGEEACDWRKRRGPMRCGT